MSFSDIKPQDREAEVAALRAQVEELTRELADARSELLKTHALMLTYKQRAAQAEAKLARVVETLHQIEDMPCLPNEPTALRLRKMAGGAILAAAREQPTQTGSACSDRAETVEETHERWAQEKLPQRTFTRSDGSPGCAECCRGHRCDDPSHFERRSCLFCKGTGGVQPQPDSAHQPTQDNKTEDHR